MKKIITITILAILVIIIMSFVEAQTTPTYTVTFTVVDSQNHPLEGAIVVLDGISEITNNIGTVIFTGIAEGRHTYSITMQNYQTETNSITVFADLTKDVQLMLAPQCTSETDTTFCSRLGKNCESVTANDNCGTSRTINCGTCTQGQSCQDNVCGTPAPLEGYLEIDVSVTKEYVITARLVENHLIFGYPDLQIFQNNVVAGPFYINFDVYVESLEERSKFYEGVFVLLFPRCY